MRYVPPAELLEQVATALRETVLPTCTDRYAAGQLWAAVGILENLATRVDEAAELVAPERQALTRWLTRWAVEPATDAEVADLRAQVRTSLAGDLPVAARTDLRDVLATLAEQERRSQRPVNFVAAFRS